MKPPPPETLEQEARRLRDLVYGRPSTDENWAYCRQRWIEDLPWLREHAAITLPDRGND